MERINNAFTTILYLLAGLALVGAIAQHAWWHFGTSIICVLLALIIKSSQEE